MSFKTLYKLYFFSGWRAKKTLIILCLLLGFQAGFAQSTEIWKNTAEAEITSRAGKRVTAPEKYRTLSANTVVLKKLLWSLPSETNMVNREDAPIMLLPMPDGSMARFRVWESTVMEPGLEAKYPEIRTFGGQGIDDRGAVLRMDYNPYFGFHAQVLTVKGSYYIDPYKNGNTDYYISYFTKNNKRNGNFRCDVPVVEQAVSPNRGLAGACRGTQLYTYRIAVACTGEYATAVCAPAAPTTATTLAAIVTSVNRVSGVYESEVAVRLILISNNSSIIFLNGATDPYSNNDGGAMLAQNQTTVNNTIGAANYDIGHVFSTGGGGIASLGVVCTNSSKARGVTGQPNPVGDNFDIDYVAHEIGHQFGANHTFNGGAGACGGNRNGPTAYEVGSGTTIMAYAGICGSDDIQPHSDPFFHAVSFDEISSFVDGGGSCHGTINTNNTLPVITAMNTNGANIPVNTPFTLSGTATDADGDAITYCWEEWDLGTESAWNGGANSTTRPLFKSRVPTADGSRTFPSMDVILAGFPANPPATMGGLKGETLPLVARAVKFRLTVRDNRAGGGGVVSAGSGCQSAGVFQVNTIGTAGPFKVLSPNTAVTWSCGSQTVTWDVKNTNIAPISCTKVRITLSIDGGVTYPYELAASTANDGSEAVTIPSLPVTSTTCRIRVEAVGNVFFDISDANFTITSCCDITDTPAFTLTATCNNGNYTVTATTTEPSPTNHWWGLMETSQEGNTDDAVTLNGLNPVSLQTFVNTAVFSNLDLSKRYYIKHGIWNEGCYEWRELRIPIIMPKATNVFNLENAAGIHKTEFCYGEDIILDGTASQGESDYYIDIWRRPENNSSDPFLWYSGLGWTNGQVGLVNLSQKFAGKTPPVYLEPGYQYSVKLALSNNANCVVWTEQEKTFTVKCCPGFIKADFLLDIIPAPSNYSLVVSGFNTYANANAVHEWYVLSSPNQTTGPYTQVASTTSTTENSLVLYNNAQYGLFYTVFHRVRTACGEVCFQRTQYQGAARGDGFSEVTTLIDCNIIDSLWPRCSPPLNMSNNCERGLLQWSPVIGATGYVVEISYNDPACCRSERYPVGARYEVKDNFLSLNSIPMPVHDCFRWRVRAKCDRAAEIWSKWLCFTCKGIAAQKEPPLVLKNNNGIDLLNSKISPQVSPNPNNGDMNLEMKVAGELVLSVNVFNAQGVLVKTIRENTYPDGRFLTRLNLGNKTSKGVYLVVFNTNFGTFRKKVVIN